MRLQVDVIMQMTYPLFYGDIGPSGVKTSDGETPPYLRKAMRMINGVITDLIDPNIFFSRISFLESGKEAIDIKNDLKLGKKVGFSGYKLPSL